MHCNNIATINLWLKPAISFYLLILELMLDLLIHRVGPVCQNANWPHRLQMESLSPKVLWSVAPAAAPDSSTPPCLCIAHPFNQAFLHCRSPPTHTHSDSISTLCCSAKIKTSQEKMWHIKHSESRGQLTFFSSTFLVVKIEADISLGIIYIPQFLQISHTILKVKTAS